MMKGRQRGSHVASDFGLHHSVFDIRYSNPPLYIPDLPAALAALLPQIPPGRVTTYGDLAEALGDLKAAKWVAEFLLNHPHDDGCPCFRVVRRTGEVGLYVTRDSAEKCRRLQADGVAVNDARVDLPRFRFAGFASDRPLQRLAALQHDIPHRVAFEPLDEVPEFVAGVDVSYAGGNAFAAYALVETATGELAASHVIRRPVTFPYISGYLSFRELPALLALVKSLPAHIPPAEVIFVDGNGVLHHRGAGIATQFGVLSGLISIGVGKKLLCGQVMLDGLSPTESSAVTLDACVPAHPSRSVTLDACVPAHPSRTVTLEGRTIGAAVKSGSRSRPIFVSTGHRTMLADAVRLTQLLFHGHRLPEPLYHADRLSREAARS
jgi:deoxyribonuclease V